MVRKVKAKTDILAAVHETANDLHELGFIDKRKMKYVFLSGAVVSLMLSWGKNFPLLTNFFIDYIPLYNKFRAVSSIQVILELCFPVLAIMGLQSFFKAKEEPKLQQKALLQTGVFGLGVIVILVIAKSFFHCSIRFTKCFKNSGTKNWEG